MVASAVVEEKGGDDPFLLAGRCLAIGSHFRHFRDGLDSSVDVAVDVLDIQVSNLGIVHRLTFDHSYKGARGSSG